MRKWLNLFWKKEKNYMQLASANCKAISEYNERMLSAITLIGGILMMLPALAAPFSKTKTDAIPVYFLAAALFFILFFIFKLSVVKNYVLGGLYICFSVFFTLAIYLSVIHTPHMRATILLGAFCIMPLGLIDRPARINTFVAFWFIIHTILAFNRNHNMRRRYYQLPVFCYSRCLRNLMIWGRLEGYEAQRFLTIEKETDQRL